LQRGAAVLRASPGMAQLVAKRFLRKLIDQIFPTMKMRRRRIHRRQLAWASSTTGFGSLNKISAAEFARPGDVGLTHQLARG
jgi:hypothetical protein